MVEFIGVPAEEGDDLDPNEMDRQQLLKELTELRDRVRDIAALVAAESEVCIPHDYSNSKTCIEVLGQTIESHFPMISGIARLTSNFTR